MAKFVGNSAPFILGLGSALVAVFFFIIAGDTYWRILGELAERPSTLAGGYSVLGPLVQVPVGLYALLTPAFGRRVTRRILWLWLASSAVTFVGAMVLSLWGMVPIVR